MLNSEHGLNNNMLLWQQESKLQIACSRENVVCRRQSQTKSKGIKSDLTMNSAAFYCVWRGEGVGTYRLLLRHLFLWIDWDGSETSACLSQRKQHKGRNEEGGSNGMAQSQAHLPRIPLSGTNQMQRFLDCLLCATLSLVCSQVQLAVAFF